MIVIDTQGKIRFRYEMIAAYNDRLVDEFTKLIELEPEATDAMSEQAQQHRATAAQWREKIATLMAPAAG
jgi:hypothetical protein